MKVRIQPWQLVTAIILACAATVGIAHLWRSSKKLTAVQMFQSLPMDKTVKIYFDVSLLRKAGILGLFSGSVTAQDPDYRRFVQDTGFDYVTDLDAVAVTLSHDSMYVALRGRFDWRRLSAYAAAQQGRCQNTICTMPASDPARNISFYPMQSDILALAVTPEPRGVVAIGLPAQPVPLTLPDQPVWVLVPGSAFQSTGGLPAGAQAFLSPLAAAQEASFTLAPSGNGGFEVDLEAACANQQAAESIAAQFTSTTNLLKQMISRERKTANPGDLSGVLTSGQFEAKQAKLVGTWPLSRDFLETLVSGKLPQ